MPPAKRRNARQTAATEETYQQVIVRMPPEMHRAIKEKAVEEDRTMSQTLRRAVRMYLGEAVA